MFLITLTIIVLLTVALAISVAVLVHVAAVERRQQPLESPKRPAVALKR